MIIYPVLDLKSGSVVHGVRGEREKYRPIETPLSPTAAPLDVARGFRSSFGLERLYLADLDAISGTGSHVEEMSELRRHGFDLIVDIGEVTTETIGFALERYAGSVIVPLESTDDPKTLEGLIRGRSDSLIFSLDLRDGRPIASDLWPDSAEGCLEMVLSAGFQRILILDLCRVGSERGPAGERLCHAAREFDPNCEVLAGGGVRRLDDLRRLSEWGASGVLVATALHNGSLSRAEIESFRPGACR